MVKKVEVYDISDAVQTEQLDSESIKNIIKLFDKIFDPDNTAHIRVTSQIKEGSVFERYHGNENEFDTSIFATDLLAAEQKKMVRETNKLLREICLFYRKREFFIY